MQTSMFMVRALYAHLSRQSLAQELLEATGLSLEHLHNPQGVADMETMMRVGVAAYRLSGDPALGLHLGENAPLQTLGVLGPLLAQCTSLRVALAEAGRYLPLLCSRGGIFVFDQGSQVRICLSFPSLPAEAQRFAMEYAFSLMLRVAREFLGGGVVPRTIRLPYAPPAYCSEYERVFGCPVEFNSERAEALVDSEFLDSQQVFANERLFRVLRDEADALLESETRGVPMHQRVQRLLKSDPKLWDAGPHVLAKLLGTSTRKLRRSLLAEGKNLTMLVEEARLHRAHYLLTETDVAIKNIAERLGYSEPSAFHRAFKRWTGQTPAHYKRRSPAGTLQATG